MKNVIKIKESKLRELIRRSVLKETSNRNLMHMAVPGETDAELEKNWLGRTTTGMSMDDYGNNGDISGFKDYVNHDAYFVGDDYNPIAEAVKKSIKEGIKKVLNESERREVFTLDIFDIENEEGIVDMQYARDYESVDEAIQAAREVAQKYADMDTVINVFVMAGEYMDAQGNVFGEPDAIYCVSNKDKETTIQARTNAGYSNPEVNEYIGGGMQAQLKESKLRAIIQEGIKKVLNESNVVAGTEFN